ncbi:hypothetical protein CLOM_g22838 [Closterium sp. NIES-68]|nr:hypothetical protein CLOM_g22838 [Closterium sp. NIES-68]GJP82599.1 hypothetical protein CLOP_g12839 [Closterium sp. NIES-67]
MMELPFVKPPFSVNNAARSSNRPDQCVSIAFACPARSDTVLRHDGGALKGLQLIANGNTKCTEPPNSPFASMCLSEMVSDFLDDPATAITAPKGGMRVSDRYDSAADTACGLAALQGTGAAPLKGAPVSTWSQRVCGCGSPWCREGQHCNSARTAMEDREGGGYDVAQLTQMVESLGVCQTAEECRLFVDVLAALKEARRSPSPSAPANAASHPRSFDTGAGEAKSAGEKKTAGAAGSGASELGGGAGGLPASGRARADVVQWLQAKGYDAALCESQWGHRKGLPGGSHEYIDVIVGSSSSRTASTPRPAPPAQEPTTSRQWPSPMGAPLPPASSFGAATRLLVDIDFRGQFHVARPSLEYASLLQATPLIFVGRSERLQQLADMLCSGMHRSLLAQGMHVPPWRRADYLRAKWAQGYRRLPTNIEDGVQGKREKEAVSAELKAHRIPVPAAEAHVGVKWTKQVGGGFHAGSTHAGPCNVTVPAHECNGELVGAWASGAVGGSQSQTRAAMTARLVGHMRPYPLLH